MALSSTSIPPGSEHGEDRLRGERSFAWPRSVFRRARREEADADAERFRRLVLPHLDAAYNYARYLARDGAAAEDIVQEAFLRAWRHFAQCRGAEKSWLLAIVRNCFHDWARAHRGFVLSTDPLDEIAEQAGDEQPEEALLEGLDVATMRETITRLPEPFREALVLRELEEMSYREIATLTAAPIGTVMSRLARGRAMLGQLLLGNGERP